MSILELCDQITPHILNEPELSKHQKFLDSRTNLNFINHKDWENCLNQLYSDRYIELIPGSDSYHFSITSSGRLFMEKGGYKNKLSEEHQKELLSTKLIESSIETNISVKETNKKINIFSLISSIVAIAALIVASIPLFTNNSNEKLLEQLIKNKEKIIKQNEILKTQFSLDSIRTNQSKKIK